MSSKLSTAYRALLIKHLYYSEAALFQGPNSLDSILNYPMYNALVDAFTIPGQQNISAVSDMVAQLKAKFKVCELSHFYTCPWI
jgi:hypothetical protein